MVAVKKACVSNGKKNIDTKKRRQLVDKNLLTYFWTLTEGNDIERVTASNKLLQRLRQIKQQLTSEVRN